MGTYDQVAWARRLKVRHLESFLVLDEAGTLTGAAARMHMTQSAMSHWLADLEELVGMPLVTRGRRIQLTAAGVVMKRLAIGVLGDISRTQLELNAVAQGRSARLHIGSVWAGVARGVPQAIAEFQQLHPYISVTVSESPFGGLLEGLENRQLDVVVGSLDARAHQARLEHRELFEDNVCLVVGRSSRLWNSDDVLRLPDLAHENWIMPPKGTLMRSQLDAALLDAGMPWLLPKVETAAVTTLQALVHQGDYVGVCSEAMAQYQQQMGNMKLLRLDRTIRFGPVGVVWSRDNVSDAVMLFVDHIQRTVSAVLPPAAHPAPPAPRTTAGA